MKKYFNKTNILVLIAAMVIVSLIITVPLYVSAADCTEHDYVGESIVKSTCTTDGIIKWTCAECGDSYEQVVKALGHEFQSGPYDDCYYECTECGETYVEEHDYECRSVVEATCTTDGVTKWVCNCGDIYEDVIEASGHNWQNAPSDDAYYICAECGEMHGEHDYEGESIVGLTCEAEGIIRWTCVGCGDSYDQVIKPLGHEFQSGPYDDCYYECTECGETYEDHEYEGESIVKSTCTTDGIIRWTCECGDSYEQVVKALGHEFQSDPDNDSYYICTECGEVMDEGDE